MFALLNKVISNNNDNMKTYNLNEIMKSAHTMRKFRPEKYSTFSEALKKAWKVAKFNKEISDRRSETNAYHEAKKQEAKEYAERAARIASERAKRLAQAKEDKQCKRTECAARVAAECQVYGYGRVNHYSHFSGWGNYCGD